MNRIKMAFLISALSAISLQACAHGELDKALNQALDEKIAQETHVKNRADLQKEVTQLIETTPDLSDEQRTELRKRRETHRVEIDSINSRSLRFRSVLIKDLVAPSYDSAEVELIKKKMKALEEERVSVLFRTIRDVNTIFGRWASANQRITSRIMNRMTDEMINYY